MVMVQGLAKFVDDLSLFNESVSHVLDAAYSVSVCFAILLYGLNFRVLDLGFRAQGLGFRVPGLGVRAMGLGFRDRSAEFRSLGSEF